jgi:hypothetical protein
MKATTRRELIGLGPLFCLTACSSAPTPKAEKKVPVPVTGLHALYGMYQNARTWAQDLQVVSCVSIAITQVAPQPGKVGAWQAVFASPSLGQKRAYTFSVVDAGDTLHEGIAPDSPLALGSDTRSFLLAAARNDSDQAWETALTRAGDYTKQHPETPISYILELSRLVNQPVWRVIWGENAASSAFSILIDASTGQYLQTVH